MLRLNSSSDVSCQMPKYWMRDVEKVKRRLCTLPFRASLSTRSTSRGLGWIRLRKPGGRLLMLEGSKQGMDSLNEFRAAFGLNPIPVKWHNLFFDDEVLIRF